MGSDLTVANAARVSFNKHRTEFLFRGDSRLRSTGRGDDDLINDLANGGHFTPFTHAVITLRETVPIFVARQRFKHTVGFSYNEVSRRYVDDKPEFYVPEVWRKRAENKKQGSHNEPVEENAMVARYYNQIIEWAIGSYEDMLADGVCPEQARMVLPQSMYTSYYVTGSLAAFARAYTLRKDSHAQKEIQDLADLWNTIIKPLFPVSWDALTAGSSSDTTTAVGATDLKTTSVAPPSPTSTTTSEETRQLALF